MSETSESMYPDHPRLAVGAVVFRNKKVLLVQRSKPPAQDQWAIPGGNVRLGETLQQAAEREIKEETGITIIAQNPVYTFDMIESDKAGKIRFHYVIVDLLAEYAAGEIQPGDDARDARWVTADELSQLNVSQRTRSFLMERFQFG